MCGRTACTLSPDEICKSCRYPNKNNGYDIPKWRDNPGIKQYTPSNNIAPSSYCPVMLSNFNIQGIKRNNEGEKRQYERIIQPMLWGLIPYFHKGTATSHGLKTNNCRVETVFEKTLYSTNLKKGFRCVVLCDGFYEWQTTKQEKNKQPYFVYSKNQKHPIWNKNLWNNDELWSEGQDKWESPDLLKMAGLYSKWISEDGEEIWSYTVLTMESGEKFNQIHHRIPAILDTEEKLNHWLDPTVNYQSAISDLSNEPDISWHPVASLVNNSRNNDPSCQIPVDLTNQKPKETPGSKFMSSWLKKGKAKK